MNKNLKKVIFAATALIAAQFACAQEECPSPAELRLTVGLYQLNLNEKRPICVAIGGQFKIVIHNTPSSGVSVGAGDATVEGKSTGGLTIEGSNQEPVNKITVTVNGDAEPGDQFEFWINVDGVGKLDPKVRVVDNTIDLRLKADAFYDLLDTLDLTLEEANKLLPPDQATE